VYVLGTAPELFFKVTHRRRYVLGLASQLGAEH